MARSSRIAVEGNKMRVLAYLVARAEQTPGAGTSYKAMARDLGLSEGRVRTAYRMLANDGLLHAEHRFDEDGAQKSNVYVPSPAAHAVLIDFPVRGARGLSGGAQSSGNRDEDAPGSSPRAGGHPCRG